MKFKIGLLGLVAMIALMLALPATGQVTPTAYGGLTGVTASLPYASTNSCTNSTVLLHKNLGLAVFPSIVCTNTAAATAVTFNFVPSYDGTNYATSGALKLILTLNGTNTVVGWTNWSADVLNNVYNLKLLNIVNADTTNAVTCNGVTYSYFY